MRCKNGIRVFSSGDGQQLSNAAVNRVRRAILRDREKRILNGLPKAKS
jgi:hypothetical protein